MTKSLGEYVVLDPEELPAAQVLIDAVTRLMKDAEVLRTYKTKKDTQNPDNLVKAANFLDLLLKKKPKQFREVNE